MWLAKYFKVVVLEKLMEKMKLKTTLKIPRISHYEIFFLEANTQTYYLEDEMTLLVFS